MILRFKVGTHSIITYEMYHIPEINNIVDLPFPNSCRKHPVRITDIRKDAIPQNSIFYGEWL